MTVAEFAEIWSSYYKDYIETKYVYRDSKISLYNLLKIHEPLTGFKIKYTLDDLNTKDLNIYTNEYDIDDLNSREMNLLNTLSIELPKGSLKSVLILCIN